MRTLILTGLAGLALIAAGDAQARGRFRAGHAHPHAEAHPHMEAHPHAGPQPGAPAPDLAVREAAGTRPVYVLLPNAGGGPDRALPALAPPVAPDPARESPAQESPAQIAPSQASPVEGGPVPGSPAQAGAPARSAAPVRVPAKAVAEAAPWCRSGRVVGTGSGFCMIN
ncbi:hypothetical protein Q8W71_27685 [Methylobacterium sp. NEAU 140]|uniref:hypothetical protein n=1 Tax=Methylobacterium sp. NEAU 140 TaxID=3064945 RepID=UPI002736E3B0|nr:hypothetical protein [Methylobacterium sp. NEAU 140]MDP4026411.1 hypothetical protein [Methylobacterium sp. NEAU 140]